MVNFLSFFMAVANDVTIIPSISSQLFCFAVAFNASSQRVSHCLRILVTPKGTAQANQGKYCIEFIRSSLFNLLTERFHSWL